MGVSGLRDPHKNRFHREAWNQTAQGNKFDPVIIEVDQSAAGEGIIPVNDAVEQGFTNGILGIIPLIGSLKAGKCRFRFVEQIDGGICFSQLRQEGAGKLFAVSEDGFVSPLENREFDGVLTLV